MQPFTSNNISISGKTQLPVLFSSMYQNEIEYSKLTSLYT